MKKAAWIVAVALLLVTGFSGLLEGIDDLRDGLPPLQSSVTIAVILYGFLGLAGAVGLARRHPWSVTVCIAWAIAVTYAATVASFAFSDPTFQKGETAAGTTAAAVSCVLIGAFVVWVARSATRVPQSAGNGHIPST